MVTGYTPFQAFTCEDVYEHVVDYCDHQLVPFPTSKFREDLLTEQCRQVISGLLACQPKDRMTYFDCRAHPFMNEFDWQGLVQDKFAPPPIAPPVLKSVVKETKSPKSPSNMVVDLYDAKLESSPLDMSGWSTRFGLRS
jgi:serine/threonine protein kinase